jgi:hypothetical protein
MAACKQIRSAWSRIAGLAAGGMCLLLVALYLYLDWSGRNSPRQPTANSTSPPAPDTQSVAATDRPSDAFSSFSPIQLPSDVDDSSAGQSAVDQAAAKFNARRDDWHSEVLSDAAIAQLSVLQAQLEQGLPLDSASIESLVDVQFQCSNLVPSGQIEVYRDDLLTVHRPDRPLTSTTPAFVGAVGCWQALEQLLTALGPGNERHAKFKLYRIERQADYFSTRVRYEGSHADASGSRQVTARWLAQWTYPQEGEQKPRLRRIEIAEFEQVEIAVPHGRLFVDCTRSALAANANYMRQVVPGINHWLTRLPREFLGQFGHHGLAVGDVNGDHLDDLYVCDAGGLPNRLYVQQPDGTAREVSSEAGIDFLEDSTGALLIDLDNDGDQDLVVGVDPNLQIAENDGSGHFRLHDAVEVNTDSFSISAADYDTDGDLDLYVCGYNVRKQDPTERGLPFPVPYFDAENGGRNVLLRNDGDFHFVDATSQAGLDENNSRFSMAAAWEDFDNDGDVDLYVANDFGRNNLYRNQGGQFSDIAAAAGVEDQASGMSVSWADFNRDGLMDLYVGNMFSAAGNRVAYQQKFSQGLADDAVTHLRHMASGNTLFVNQSRGGVARFGDVSEQAAVEMGRWAWASKFVDLTNDAWPDLVVANGYVTNTDKDDL